MRNKPYSPTEIWNNQSPAVSLYFHFILMARVKDCRILIYTTLYNDTLKFLESENEKSCIQTNFESFTESTASDDDDNSVLPFY